MSRKVKCVLEVEITEMRKIETHTTLLFFIVNDRHFLLLNVFFLLRTFFLYISEAFSQDLSVETALCSSY